MVISSAACYYTNNQSSSAYFFILHSLLLCLPCKFKAMSTRAHTLSLAGLLSGGKLVCKP